MTKQRQTDSYAATRRPGGQEPAPERFDDEAPTAEDVADARVEGYDEGIADAACIVDAWADFIGENWPTLADMLDGTHAAALRQVAHFVRQRQDPAAVAWSTDAHRPGGAS